MLDIEVALTTGYYAKLYFLKWGLYYRNPEFKCDKLFEARRFSILNFGQGCGKVFFKKIDAIPGLFFLYFLLFNTVDSKC